MKVELALAALGALLNKVDASTASLHHAVQHKFMQSIDNTNFRLPLAERPKTFKNERINCSADTNTVEVDGEVYDCSGIDFLSFISSEDLLIAGSQFEDRFSSSDIWGWFDERTEREFTLLTMDNGLVVIDSTQGTNPCIIAKSHSSRPPSAWGDIKVVGDFAYSIKDFRGPFDDTHPSVGMEVYNLTKFSEMDCQVEDYVVPYYEPDYVGTDHGRCHNIVSSTESGRVYSVGCRESCAGGLTIFDVTEDPRVPKKIGCAFEDGYTHDAQCVRYSGPDERYLGHEICLAFNEDTLTIWDVTFADVPKIISRVFYLNQAYSHQGWFNKDMTKVLLDDELDEICNEFDDFTEDEDCAEVVKGELSGLETTSTVVFDVTDLENPVEAGVFDFGTPSIDHNLYVWGPIHERGWGGNKPLEMVPDPDLAFMNNYMAGLRVVNISEDSVEDWNEVKYFDITNETEIEFFGCWSGYMHPSGVYALSSIEKGIFFLDPNVELVPSRGVPDLPDIATDAPTTLQPTTDAPNAPGTEETDDDEPGEASPVLIVLFIICVIGVVALAHMLVKESKNSKASPDENQLQA